MRVDISDWQFAPIALVVAIQTSDLSLSALAKIRKVGAMIPEAVVGANGEAAVVTFSDRVTVAQDFTSDADAITNAFRNLKPADSSEGRLIDAVDEALRMLSHRAGSRRCNILVISESKDRGSEGKLQNLVGNIQHSGVTIYTLTYSAYLTPFTTRPSDYTPPAMAESSDVRNEVVIPPMFTELARLAKKNTVEALAKTTGGRQMSFETKSKLENDLIRLGAEIHSRYLLFFTPDLDQKPEFHQLEVQIRSHPKAVIRTRLGYWSGTEILQK